MIPLRLRAELDSNRRAPFVVRLQDNLSTDRAGFADMQPEQHLAELVTSTDDLTFHTQFGTLRLRNVRFEDVKDDVLLVVPDRGIAHRLIRSNSQDNTLLVTEQCDQLCIMCSQPPKKDHVDLFEHFLVAAKLAPRNALIGLSGGEPTLHKEALFDFLSHAYEVRSDLRFHVLTNAQHFSDDDLETLATPALHNVCWGIPIYSADPAQHDAIVKKPGAFETLLHSFAILLQAGSHIELRTVLLRENEPDLTSLAAFIATHLSFVAVWAIMQLENIGFARKEWDQIFFDNSQDFSQIASAINEARARGVAVELYNFPLCTIPAAYRDYAVQSISDWKMRYLETCQSCSSKQCCSGFFEWYLEDKGFANIRPL